MISEIHCIIVSDKTGITAALLRGKLPLSKVFPEFLKWVYNTTAEVSENTGTPHIPGMIQCNCKR